MSHIYTDTPRRMLIKARMRSCVSSWLPSIQKMTTRPYPSKVPFKTGRSSIRNDGHPIFFRYLDYLDHIIGTFWVSDNTMTDSYTTTRLFQKFFRFTIYIPGWWTFSENPWAWRSSGSVDTLLSMGNVDWSSWIAFLKSSEDPNWVDSLPWSLIVWELGTELATVKPTNPAAREVKRSAVEEYLAEFWATVGLGLDPCEENWRSAATERILRSILRTLENPAFVAALVHNIRAVCGVTSVRVSRSLTASVGDWKLHIGLIWLP